MEANEYRALCKRPDVFTRAVLLATIEAISSRHLPSTVYLEKILEGSPIPKPERHQNGPETDFFQLTLEVSKAEEIMEYFLDAESDAAMEDERENTRSAGRFADLVDAWVRYIDYCDEKAV